MSARTDSGAATIGMGNNDAVTIGIVPQAAGTFLALTYAASKTWRG